MTLYIGIYLYMTFCTTVASVLNCINKFNSIELIGSLIFGLFWPFVLTARIIQKIIK